MTSESNRRAGAPIPLWQSIHFLYIFYTFFTYFLHIFYTFSTHLSFGRGQERTDSMIWSSDWIQNQFNDRFNDPLTIDSTMLWWLHDDLMILWPNPQSFNDASTDSTIYYIFMWCVRTYQKWESCGTGHTWKLWKGRCYGWTLICW